MSIFLFERDNEKSVIDNLRLLIQMSLKSIELLKDYMNSKDEKIDIVITSILDFS